MARVSVETTASRGLVGRSADDVWGVLRRFEDLSWALGHGVSAFESTGSGVGMIRIAVAPHDGGRIGEKLTRLDETDRSLEYVIVEGGLPLLEDYVAVECVRPVGKDCEVRWRCQATVAPGQASQGQAILDAMADRMVELFAAQFVD